MYYPPAKFGDMSGCFCVKRAHTYVHMHPHTYRAAKRHTHSSDYIGMSNNNNFFNSLGIMPTKGKYCKTLYFCCILISQFWNVEISLLFNLAFS